MTKGIRMRDEAHLWRRMPAQASEQGFGGRGEAIVITQPLEMGYTEGVMPSEPDRFRAVR